jgi:hypothetical protein
MLYLGCAGNFDRSNVGGLIINLEALRRVIIFKIAWVSCRHV